MSSNNEQLTSCNKYNRRYSDQIKRQAVELIVSNQASMAAVSRQFGVSRGSLYKWIYRYSDRSKGTRMVVEMESEHKRNERLLARVAQLERIVGQKQLEIDLLEQTILCIEADLGLDDVKKKYALKLSNDSNRNTP